MDMLPEHALGTLAAAGRGLAEETSLENALSALADAAAAAAGAEVAVVRVVDDSGRSLQARAIAARSEAVAAELVGSRFSLLELPFEETAEVEMMPAQVRAAADRVSADSLLLLPAWADGRPLGSLELMRAGSPFGSEEVAVARLAAVQLGLVLRALHGGNGAEAARLSVETSLALAGDALAAGYDPARIGDQVVRVAVTATGAVAERMLELALGPLRTQGILEVSDAAADLRLAGVRDAVLEAGIEATLAVPLLVHEELIGLLAVYVPAGHASTENERTLFSALAAQLAVAVQNARLHEDVERLAADRERALDLEGARSRELTALHEIASSFAESLRLDATLDAVAKAAVELLGVDAAVIRMHDLRGGLLVPMAAHVAEPRLEEALKPILEQPQDAQTLPGRRLFRMGRALVLDPDSASRLGASYELLVPFLEHGSTAVVVPIATPAELLATMTIVSLDPARRIGESAVELALSVAAQAALAIDNARLYQQQKDFADTMQRSLLPQELPDVPGLELGAVYESSARVDVGGDVYDFLSLPDGRLAAVLGDVTGHGIAATADMALARFVFRSLAREHPEPSEFLAHANEVAHGELSGGNFITMICLTVDPAAGEVAAASAGHPAPRLLAPDGSVTALAPRGLALGVETEQTYEAVHAPLPAGGAVCLYTDGILEARRGGEQYGEQRLDAALGAGADFSAQALAEHVLGDCRAWAGDDLAVDCAVVIV